MVDTCPYVVKTLEYTAPRVNHNVSYGFKLIIMYQYWHISYNKSTILMQDVRKGCMCVWGNSWKLFSLQSLHKPETSLKNNLLILKSVTATLKKFAEMKKFTHNPSEYSLLFLHITLKFIQTRIFFINTAAITRHHSFYILLFGSRMSTSRGLGAGWAWERWSPSCPPCLELGVHPRMFRSEFSTVAP